MNITREQYDADIRKAKIGALREAAAKVDSIAQSVVPEMAQGLHWAAHRVRAQAEDVEWGVL